MEEGDGAFLLAFCYLFGVVVDGRMERVRITKGIEMLDERLAKRREEGSISSLFATATDILIPRIRRVSLRLPTQAFPLFSCSSSIEMKSDLKLPAPKPV